MLSRFYHIISYILWVIVLPWLWIRTHRRGESARWRERLGYSDIERPHGVLIWFHAVSLGEAQSLLPLIAHILNHNPQHNILITTGTPSAAERIAEQQKQALYQNLIHQYLPYDHPFFVTRFLMHWNPTTGILVESELWPNLIRYTARRKIDLILLNARISDRSFRLWQNKLLGGLIRNMLARFTLILAQDKTSASRLLTLGAHRVETPGNLKFNAPALAVDKAALAKMRKACMGRQLWLAASTHRGEEKIIAHVHKTLKPRIPNLLTICVPRHSPRGDEITTMLRTRGLNVSQRSRNDVITPATDIYLADSFGELGLFYRLCPISLIGGSMIAHGGQNPLEAVRLESAILHGSYIHNFAAIFDLLQTHAASIVIEDADNLAEVLANLFAHSDDVAQLRDSATHIIQNLDDTCTRSYDLIRPFWESPHA